MADETSGLPTTAQDEAVAKYGTKGNISVGGLKGVSLEGPQSTDIRQRLAQMIADRENYANSWQGIGELAAVGVSSPGEFSRNYADYMTRQRQREQDLFGMHVQQAQLSSEEARLQREAAMQQRVAEMFGMGPQAQAPAGGGVYPTQGADTMTSTAPSTGGLGLSAPSAQGPGTEGQPAGGLSAVRPQNAYAAPGAEPGSMKAQISTLSPAEKYAYATQGLDPKTRPEMLKQLQARFAPTTLERELEAAGMSPQDRRAGIMATRFGDALKEIKTYDPKTGYENPVPTNLLDVARQRLGLAQANAPAPAAGGTQTAAPTAPAQGPVNYSLAAGPTSDFGTNPFPFGTEDWRKRNAELAKAQTEVLTGSEKELNTAANKQLEGINTTKDQSMQVTAKIDAVLPNIKKYPDIFGSQSKPGAMSIFANALADKSKPFDQVITSLLESYHFPKDGKQYREARETLIATKGIFDELTALRAKEMFGGGQGQTDKDMAVAKNIVGDPRRLNEKTIDASLKVLRDGINFKNQMADVYNEKRAAGSNMTYAQFLRSPEYLAAEKEKRAEYAKHLSVLTAPGTTPAEPARDFSKPTPTGASMTPDQLEALRKKTAERFNQGAK